MKDYILYSERNDELYMVSGDPMIGNCFIENITGNTLVLELNAYELIGLVVASGAAEMIGEL